MGNKIEIYTGPACYYCVLAKKLLDKKKLDYVEIELNSQPNKKTEMLKRSNGKKTIPQIFINDLHIGGFDELNSLEISGKLNKLLSNK